jgi:hypothetical protein
MADEFYINEDIKVEISLPSGTNGIWGLSKWNNSEKWGNASSFAWTDIVATVSRAEVSLGGSVENGFYVPATPNQLNIQFQSDVFDPANNKFIRPNVPIKVSYRAKPDTAPSTWTVLFNGFIDTFDTSYDPFGNNLVNLIASSSLKRYLSKNLASFTATGITDSTYYNNWCTAVGISGGLVYEFCNGSIMATETFTDVGAGEVLDNMLQIDNGLFYEAPDTGLFVAYGSFFMRNSVAVPDYTFSNTHSSSEYHICISNIDVTYDLDTSFNSYFVDSVTDGIVQKSSNQDLVDLYGEIRFETSLHIQPADLVANWLPGVIKKNPGLKVNSIETPAIRRDGKLAQIFNPGRKIRVQLTQDSFTINEDNFVTKATHLIDPDNWFTTLEVWKGF